MTDYPTPRQQAFSQVTTDRPPAKGETLWYPVDLGFAEEWNQAKVQTGNVCQRDPLGILERVPCVWVELDCGTRTWEPLSNLYRRRGESSVA